MEGSVEGGVEGVWREVLRVCGGCVEGGVEGGQSYMIICH